MNTESLSLLSDAEVLDATMRAAIVERDATVKLIALISEVEARGLYLAQGCSSLFKYCTEVLRLSEHAAYHRIEAARAARRYPVILQLLTDGEVTLTTVKLLRPHLTPANHLALLSAARHKSKQDVLHQVACLAPKVDAKAIVRLMPEAVQSESESLDFASITPDPSGAPVVPAEPPIASTSLARPTRPMIAPSSADRYLLRITISRETHAKLRCAQDLLRHSIPNGDPAVILDRALTDLIDRLERVKFGKGRVLNSSATQPSASRNGSRHIPSPVRREVWNRDGGRCTFEGVSGRCTETGWLEFHHIVPFASGGPTVTANLALRCRAHNKFEGGQRFRRCESTMRDS